MNDPFCGDHQPLGFSAAAAAARPSTCESLQLSRALCLYVCVYNMYTLYTLERKRNCRARHLQKRERKAVSLRNNAAARDISAADATRGDFARASVSREVRDFFFLMLIRWYESRLTYILVCADADNFDGKTYSHGRCSLITACELISFIFGYIDFSNFD